MIKKLKFQNSKLSTVTLAALIGGMAGAVVSLMFAPKSGKELRQNIRDKTENVIVRVEDATLNRAEALKQQGTSLVDKGKKITEEFQTFLNQSLKSKKSDPSAVNDSVLVNDSKDTQMEASIPPPSETKPEILVQPNIQPEEEKWGTITT